MENVNFEDFSKLDIRIGEVLEAEEVEGSDRLIKQTVDFGKLGRRTILSGIKKWYQPKDIIGKKLLYIVNLSPKELFGIESQGMLLAAAPEKDGEKLAVLIEADKNLDAGTKVI